MDKFRIISWNSQGAGIRKIGQSFGSLLAHDRYNVILVQEAGNPQDFKDCSNSDGIITIGSRTRGWEFSHLAEAQAYAVNPRCSLAMLAPYKDRIAAAIHSIYPVGAVTRPCLFTTVNFGNGRTLVANMHALSDHGRAGSQEEIAYWVKRFNEGKKRREYDHWLLMGDFNNPPQVLHVAFDEHCDCKYSGQATQRQGYELDYALYSKNNPIIRDARIYTGSYMDSDHVPVILDIN